MDTLIFALLLGTFTSIFMANKKVALGTFTSAMILYVYWFSFHANDTLNLNF